MDAAPTAPDRLPVVGMLTQEIADFVSGQVLGVILGMAFRWWAFRRFVFPDVNVRRRPAGADHDPVGS